jgi:hypothetical protein
MDACRRPSTVSEKQDAALAAGGRGYRAPHRSVLLVEPVKRKDMATAEPEMAM